MYTTTCERCAEDRGPGWLNNVGLCPWCEADELAAKVADLSPQDTGTVGGVQ
ncbi:hypothetical protein EV193_105393 [Herbihabitans rhizosphaerae]|uniref:Uncharacterized protein n=1 Tax=Herbihabitans rhizosphaerae TaxID=1872711 RepID=A0A4V2ESJ9_9PSEU|nr:hypothetical protein EV193_105393 [Herbihabitans rhizosphaerae]